MRRNCGSASRQARSTAVARRSASARNWTRSCRGISASAFARGVFSEKDAVSGEELDVADHGVAALEFSEDRGVLSSCC